VRYLLHQMVSEGAARRPDAQAVSCGGRSLTYAELDAAANGIAQALRAAGVQRGYRVALQVPKDLEMLPAVYGVLKAGAAFVPLSAADPVERRAFVVSDCDVSALVASASAAAEVVGAVGHDAFRLAIVVPDGSDEPAGSGTGALGCPTVTYADAIADPSAGDPAVPMVDLDLAFVMYTSGSTGVPKGVMQTHRALLACTDWWTSLIGVGEDDRLAVVAPLHFIASAFVYFAAASVGATAVVVQDRFLRDLGTVLRDERATFSLSVPTPYVAMARAGLPGGLPDLRALVFGGDRFPPRDLRALREVLPDVPMWHCYGSTEACGLTYYRVLEPPAQDEYVPIGRGWGNTEVFAVDDAGSVAGVGEEGELYVRGSVVMKGYWGHPDRNGEVLVQNPLTPHIPEIVFRTGDMVRQRPDGNYEFLGRRDQQIKVRGFRIELGEIDAAMQSHPAVLEAAAVALPDPEWGNVIVGFVVPKDEGVATGAEIRSHVSERLPRVMVPRRILVVEELPRTSTDKIDRAALAGVASRHAMDGPPEGPDVGG
jgi:amino acid adenylation domain-containing protein